jgi:hypothetical protein
MIGNLITCLRTAVLNMAIIPSSMFVSTPLNERPGH